MLNPGLGEAQYALLTSGDTFHVENHIPRDVSRCWWTMLGEATEDSFALCLHAEANQG